MFQRRRQPFLVVLSFIAILICANPLLIVPCYAQDNVAESDRTEAEPLTEDTTTEPDQATPTTEDPQSSAEDAEPASEEPADKQAPVEEPANEKAEPAKEKAEPAKEKTEPAKEKTEPEEKQPEPLTEASAASSQAGPAAAAFDETFANWKALLKDLRDMKLEAQIADDEKLAELQTQWDAKILAGREMEPKLREAALAAYQESPNEDRELVRYLITVIADLLRADDYRSAQELVSVLVDNQCAEKEIDDLAGIAAFGSNNYEVAEERLKKADESGTISSQGSKFLGQVTDCKLNWEKELEVQSAETAKNDLPRVQLETDAGDIVLELFENEAPETVGNFISLVEKGFYNGLGFHRVLEAFMAQGGCPNGDGSGSPGYNIYCECGREDFRKHFAGSLSMAKQPAKNTGGAQFFITFVSTPFLDGEHTVFGRVIEGWDVLPKIVKRDPAGAPPFPDATKIVKATVLRKREHEYRPNKVK